MTNKTKELKTYTMQELYEHPLEPMACLVDGLLAPGLYILGGSPKVGKSWMALQLCLAVCGGKAFLGRATRKSEVLYLALEDGPQRLHSRALRLADTAAFRLLGQHYAQNDGFAVTEAGYRGIPPPKTPRSMQPHGTGRCIMDQARRCCSSQTIRVGFSALMRRARTVNTRMVSSVKTTSHTAR